MREKRVTIIGGGLAGSEAAWQAAESGCQVDLYEMRPDRYSPAHSSPALAELVCSNSFRSDDQNSAVGLLKEEMRRLGSLVIRIAEETKVPAGKALAVDREKFAGRITKILEAHPAVNIIRREVPSLPDPSDHPVILATGPLTSDSMAGSLRSLTGRDHLAFYDAIAPIISSESLNMGVIYQASRYDDGPGDYLNCPMNEEQYRAFADKLLAADKVPLKSFEDVKYFEGCLPVEVMFERGIDTARFGPMKPVGLPDPQTGTDPYAVVQLRKENRDNTAWNMVGFQTKLTYSAQREVFRMIPGMENAEFLRLGSIHRNTFVCGPEVLQPTLQTKARADLFLAGQITGVEGYVESTAMGFIAGLNASRMAHDREKLRFPAETAHGALVNHVTGADPGTFQPSNINFSLFPPIGRKMPKRMRGRFRAELALKTLKEWCKTNDLNFQ